MRFPEHGNDIHELNSAVEAAGGLTLSQHQVFQPSGHPVEVAMEVTAGWGRYLQTHPETFFRPLRRGARLGFVANGDTHRRAPGLSGALTAIYATELTSEAILDALRKRRCYATNGSRIFIDSRLNGSMMGQVATDAGQVNLTLHVIGTRPLERVTLFRDGEILRQFAVDATREHRVQYTDSTVDKGTHWYFWRVEQTKPAEPLPGNLMTAFGHLGWSTPHWITVAPGK